MSNCYVEMNKYWHHIKEFFRRDIVLIYNLYSTINTLKSTTQVTSYFVYKSLASTQNICNSVQESDAYLYWILVKKIP